MVYTHVKISGKLVVSSTCEIRAKLILQCLTTVQIITTPILEIPCFCHTTYYGQSCSENHHFHAPKPF